MKKTMNNGYREINLDLNGRGCGRTYDNPLSGTFRCEYALYKTVSELFESVRCRSMCIASLKLYFSELPERKESRHKSREDYLDEMKALVDRDVVGHINFPMINVCTAEVNTIPEKDGTHSFVFSDGIYSFRLHLEMNRAKPVRIRVENLVDLTRCA